MSFTRFHLTGVQLRPLAAKALFGISCSELQDWALHGGVFIREMDAEEKIIRSLPDSTHARIGLKKICGTGYTILLN